MRLVVVFVCGLLGAVTVIVPGYYIFTSTQSNDCPAINGRVCNYPRGICDAGTGLCACNATYSGVACHNTQVAGWSATTNKECSGNGFVPFFPASRVSTDCRETVSSVLAEKIGGWDNPPCALQISESRTRLELGTFTTFDVLHTPMCLCKPGYVGVACETYTPACANIDGLVCSGNGNTSVGIMANDTVTGEGCQCRTPLSVRKLVHELTRDEVRIIQRQLVEFGAGVALTRRACAAAGPAANATAATTAIKGAGLKLRIQRLRTGSRAGRRISTRRTDISLKVKPG